MKDPSFGCQFTQTKSALFAKLAQPVTKIDMINVKPRHIGGIEK